MSASIATDPTATTPTEDPGRDEPTSDQLRKIMAQLKDLKNRSAAKAQETAAVAATAKEKCDQVSAKVAAAIKDIKEKGVNEQMAIIKAVKDGQEALESMTQEIQETETQMEILMRRRYPDWEDFDQSSNRRSHFQETGTKSAEKAIKAALRNAPKPQRTAEFKTAESSRPKPLTDKEVDEAMKGFAHHTQALEPTAMVSEQWQLETKEAIERDNCIHRANPSKHLPGPKGYSQGIRLQLLENLEFQYDRWKERDKLQIQREEASAIKPAKRRQIMRRPRLEARSRDSRTAAVPPIPRPWRDDLLSRRQVVLSTIAQELRDQQITPQEPQAANPPTHTRLTKQELSADPLAQPALASIDHLVASVRRIRATTDEVIDARTRIDETLEDSKELDDICTR
ncbi:hypothetical protein BX070DRAFT_255229 [Coemansia spiralis]|nr:hypothetical protein BX070DRAFT_255229 [Coemansia spiralis]